jgi:hypothetical protein
MCGNGNGSLHRTNAPTNHALDTVSAVQRAAWHCIRILLLLAASTRNQPPSNLGSSTCSRTASTATQKAKLCSLATKRYIFLCLYFYKSRL